VPNNEHPNQRARLAQLVAILGSENDGECLAACRALGKELNSHRGKPTKEQQARLIDRNFNEHRNYASIFTS
jgi:hypothetical protein